MKFPLWSLMNSWVLTETITNCSPSIVPLFLALSIGVVVGVVVGWMWKPGMVDSFLCNITRKRCLLWTNDASLKAQESMPSPTEDAKPSTATIQCPKCSSCSSMQVFPASSSVAPWQEFTSPSSLAVSVIDEQDLLDLERRFSGREGGLPWESMMERSAPGISYQAWRRDPQGGPTEYKSRTVFEDATPELVKDYYWDDEFRAVWDDMLIYSESLERCEDTGAEIVRWVRKFPFFCSDREYIIGRRIFEVEGTFFCVTKAAPYTGVPRRERPLRVDIYSSSWCIRAAESVETPGQMTACEVMFFHAEDMHIPKAIAKVGIRQGMWGCLRKMEPALRKYQAHRSSAKALSESARMAQLYTRMPPNFFEVSRLITPELSATNGPDSQLITANLRAKEGNGQGTNGALRWLIVGGAVLLACTLDRGAVGRVLVYGVARRFGRINPRLSSPNSLRAT